MDYFDKLKFGFTPEYRAGLQEFYRRAVGDRRAGRACPNWRRAVAAAG